MVVTAKFVVSNGIRCVYYAEVKGLRTRKSSCRRTYKRKEGVVVRRLRNNECVDQEQLPQVLDADASVALAFSQASH